MPMPNMVKEKEKGEPIKELEEGKHWKGARIEIDERKIKKKSDCDIENV